MNTSPAYLSSAWKAFLAALLLTLAIVPTGAVAAAGEEPSGAIVGRVFLDEDANATFEDCDCDCALENIPVRLYRDHCGGQIVQTVRTDADGYFRFKDVEAGEYCVMPKVKMICEGFQPTTPITQKVSVAPGETAEAAWFGLDHYLDIND